MSLRKKGTQRLTSLFKKSVSSIIYTNKAGLQADQVSNADNEIARMWTPSDPQFSDDSNSSEEECAETHDRRGKLTKDSQTSHISHLLDSKQENESDIASNSGTMNVPLEGKIAVLSQLSEFSDDEGDHSDGTEHEHDSPVKSKERGATGRDVALFHNMSLRPCFSDDEEDLSDNDLARHSFEAESETRSSDIQLQNSNSGVCLCVPITFFFDTYVPKGSTSQD